MEGSEGVQDVSVEGPVVELPGREYGLAGKAALLLTSVRKVAARPRPPLSSPAQSPPPP